jgi:hypothetical protein
MSGGQGRKEGQRQGGVLHCRCGDRLQGQDIDRSKMFGLLNAPKQSMLSQCSIILNECDVLWYGCCAVKDEVPDMDSEKSESRFRSDASQ